ncbi:SWIM zinc finger family protein [Nocardia sp. CDC159]|uniref:SWIM zinc finger family protein n=1 Tax=Nocardia pulmonis TaxID=2951408 RepID=A0A9X2J0H8_9NOCA|nr:MULTISPECIES: SWIM zinc finger family protein [Nocardia]MCM6777834.1 SWIM zinc finger family protein [Nocardia pulmonis]MCM6790718.1 SWIM zinc finger family protein [Nocardia sp. CDC159]
MSPSEDYSKYGKRLPVRGGVEPRSRRGSFARTWWGRSFIDAVEQVADPGRLARGRSYARSGQVVTYHLEPGAVTAEVQGSQPRPFTAVLTLRKLRDERLDELIDQVRGTPGMLAQLASGALPKELGPLLLPTTAAELDFACTCPDSGWPCKHVAAVCYIIAERLDEQPSAMLVLRGLDLDTLIGGVQADNGPTLPDDLYGETTPLPALPTPDFRPALEDLDPNPLRQALRMTAEDEKTAEAGLRDLRTLYHGLRE